MMLRFLTWMVIFFIAVKIIGQIIRSIRSALTPNNDVMNSNQQPRTRNGKVVEDIPYEEVKDKQ
jgi:hypothetical protein